MKRVIPKKSSLNIHNLSGAALDQKLFGLKEREIVSVSRQLLSRQNTKVHLTLLEHLIRISKGSTPASKLIERIALVNQNPKIRLEAARHLRVLVKGDFPLSLLTVRQMQKDPIPKIRAFALSAAVEMARKGDKRVINEFIHSIKTETHPLPFDIAEGGLFELAMKGNPVAKKMVEEIQNGKYRVPSKRWV